MLGALTIIFGIGYCALTSEPSENSRTKRIERLVSDSQSLSFQVRRFNEDNWREVVPEVRQFASVVEQDAYLLRDDDHRYRRPMGDRRYRAGLGSYSYFSLSTASAKGARKLTMSPISLIPLTSGLGETRESNVRAINFRRR